MARFVCRKETSLALGKGVLSLIAPDLRSCLGAVSRSLNTKRYLTEQLFALALGLGVWTGWNIQSLLKDRGFFLW